MLAGRPQGRPIPTRTALPSAGLPAWRTLPGCQPYARPSALGFSRSAGRLPLAAIGYGFATSAGLPITGGVISAVLPS